jgi:hypothetical protein
METDSVQVHETIQAQDEPRPLGGKNLIISIHVPKTAGTTVGYLLDYGYGRRVLWDYADDYSNATALDATTSRHIEFLEHWFRVIHGHFFYRKYASIFPGARYVVTVRHPVARIKSQFLHLALDPNVHDWRRDSIITGKMDIVDFVRSDSNLRRAHAAHIEGRQIEDFDFVFITEHLPLCVKLFHRAFNFKRRDPLVGEGIPALNKGDKRSLIFNPTGALKNVTTITPQQEQAVFNLISEDIEIYVRALEKLKTLQQKFGN